MSKALDASLDAVSKMRRPELTVRQRDIICEINDTVDTDLATLVEQYFVDGRNEQQIWELLTKARSPLTKGW